MKNIFIIPTDKPSRLFDCFGKLSIGDFNATREDLQVTNQNIYITNDEEIKEGDWRLDVRNGNVYKSNKADSELYDNTFRKKIILTTDQDLIKDGVQAIDDDFLNWFVNNPSCESVEIVSELNLNGKNGLDRARFIYKIIIPKEEPMSYEEFRESASNDLIRKFDTDCSKYSEDGHSDNYFYANCKYWENKLKEEPKQENKVLVEMQQILRRDSKFMGHYESCDLCHYNAFFKYLYNGEILYRCQGHKIVDINNLKSKFGFGSNEPKQETLEEFIKKAYLSRLEDCLQVDFEDGVKLGVKWQQEQNGLTPNDLIEFSKWVNKMGYSHRLTIIPNDLIDFYLKNRENIIKLNLE
jgi:hypothetical protein